MDPRVLHFYTTTGCHLCEQAMALLVPVVAGYGLHIESHDIADDDTLMVRYGVRIPVVWLEGAAVELGWPFDEQALQDYLGGD